MAVQAEASAHIDPQLVGNSFVEQYYKVLHQYPEQLHRFYQDSSCLTRPGPDGLMISVTTTKEISEQILFLDYQNYQTEILAVDAQGSYCSGVVVLVTGYLIGKDIDKKKFAQSFFLAPQENGFYVLNDVFRFVDDKQPLVMAVINAVEESAPLSPLAPHSEPTHVPSDAMLDEATVPSAEDTIANNAKEVDDILTNSKGLVPEKGSDVAVPNQKSTLTVAVTDSPRAYQNGNIQVAVTRKDSPRALQNGIQTVTVTDSPRALQNGIQTVTVTDSPRALQNGTHTATETNSSRTLAQDDASKKSFASIVNALKDNSAPFQVRVPPPNSSKLSRAAAGSKASGPIINNNIRENPAKSLSIFVANLPMDVTVEQVRQIFLKFGPIKPNGVKVRTNQLRPNCFSFVEFESSNSVLNALKASPIAFGDRKVFIEEKKGTPIAGSGNVAGFSGNVAGLSGNDNVRRSVVGNQIDSIKTRANSNGRKAQGGVRNGVDSPKAHQNHEGAGRVQSRAHQKDGGRVETKHTNSVQQNKAVRAAK